MRIVAILALLISLPLLLAATDPKGDAKDPARDIINYSISTTDNAAVINLEVAADWNFDAVQVFLDTMPGKGFKIADITADLMIEGAAVYQYTGSGADWTWKRIGEAQRQVAGKKLTLQIPRTLIGADQTKVVIRTLSSDWQSAMDTAPDSSSATLDFKSSPATQPPADTTDPANDAQDPTLDITKFDIAQQGNELVVKITARQAGDFGTYLIFLDTDCNAATGFNPPADPLFGFDMLINGDQLLRHTGPARDAWQWEKVGQARRSILANTLTLKVDAGRLGTHQLDAAVWAMSKDWQTLVDRAPDRGLVRVKIDAAAAATQPQAQMAPPKTNRNLPARQRVREAQSFYCYYGSGKVAELSHYDLVILHTPAMSREDVKSLRNLGVVTVGYLTVGEDPPPQPRKGDGAGPGGFASWYFDDNHDHQPDMNPTWHSYYANANDPQWRADRVAEARRLVEDYGFDGIFLDTLDTATAHPQTKPGMIQLVSDLRAALPNAPIILNQGFSMLPQLAPLADGLMLESFTATYDFESQTYLMNYPQSIDYHLMRVKNDILPVLEKYPLRVLVLDYAQEDQVQNIQEAANRAATFGFLFAAAPISLDAVYQLDITGHPDPKWQNKMTTPQMLSLKLEQPANGFAAGTIIVPSGDFAGYSVAPMFDGLTDRSGLHWSRAAWASAEDGEAPWLEIHLPQPRQGGILQIDFEPSHPSRNFTLSTRTGPNDPWKPVKQFSDNDQKSVQIPLPADPYQALRLDQPPDGGHPNRPNLLWIAQIRLLESNASASR